MKIRFTGLVLPILMLAAGAAWAQDNGEQTIEELYLRDAVKTQIIRAEADSPDRDMKMFAIKDLELMIDDGSGDNPEVISILRDLSGEGITRVTREQGLVINDFPEVRREAARLLGEVGGDQAAQALSTILLTDPEPMVMSEAIFAISKLDVEDTTARNRSMAAAIYRQTAVKKDNNFAYTFLLSVENVVSREGTLTDPMIFEEIAKIADARQGYNRVVRERAMQLIRDLQDY